MSGCVVCPGLEEDHSSYRSKLAGIFAVIKVVNKLCGYHNITEGGITLGCDGLLALQSSFHNDMAVYMDSTNFDIISAIRSAICSSPIQWCTWHIIGHQDKVTNELNIWAKLNIEMNRRAKEHLVVAHATPCHQSIPGEPWSLSSSISKRLYLWVHKCQGDSYWEGKADVTSSSLAVVD